MIIQRRGVIATVAVVALAVSFLAASRGNCGKSTPPSGAKASSQEDAPPIQVLVAKLTPEPNRVMYRYTVINRSRFPITTLLVGDDYYWGVPRLAGYPIGWDGDTIPSTSYRSPPGWSFVVQPTEEDSLIVVKWQVFGQNRTIMGGESLGGFAVILEKPDQTYDVGGVWTAYVRGASPFFGSLQPLTPARTPPHHRH